MTEEEAKTKWCPMVRFTYLSNRSDDPSDGMGALCIGSACMMWRAGVSHKAHSDGGHISYEALPPEEREGHCGLAGKP